MDTIHSPCIGICQLDASMDMCAGCFRTRHEVAIWSDASDDQKKEILARAKSRRSAIKKENFK